MSSQEIADKVRKWQGGWKAAYEIERLSNECKVLEAKRRALWSALVDAYVETGSRLGEAQIEADLVMGSVSTGQTHE